MIVYSSTKDGFIRDVQLDCIEDIIRDKLQEKLSRRPSRSEFGAWKASLTEMFKVLLIDGIPGSAGVAVEYNIPLTGKRVDFILSGEGDDGRDVAIIIELKQWREAEATDKDAVVRTFLNGGEREVSHPSYQAWSYAALIEDFNETVRQENVLLKPCAYLHNMEANGPLSDARYQPHINNAPLFFRRDAQRLADFIKQFVRRGDRNKVIYRIEHGIIKPSKSLIDGLASMLRNNPEFVLIDDQKVVYETALQLAGHSRDDGRKRVLIVQGGPGTGKTVVAINLLVEAIKQYLLVHYVTKNAAPRRVFESRLTGTLTRTRFSNLFKGSGSYHGVEANYFDLLVVDEAHRLNEKSGMYKNLGENQVKEIIRASQATVFFIDEDQRVTFDDIGTVEEIARHAKALGAVVDYTELQSQFRCNGSDGYLAWVDNALQIRDTANETLEGIDYDLQVFDDPRELKRAILDHNMRTNKARMVAGYCWDWPSKKNPALYDIHFPEFGFKARWNLDKDGPLWLVTEGSVDEIGCIHTCQGLELDYVGVIIGPDLVIREGVVVADAAKRSKQDSSVRGYKSRLKENPSATLALADRVIKSTYRTLMTRGTKGCYLYSPDAETREYFRDLSSTMDFRVASCV